MKTKTSTEQKKIPMECLHCVMAYLNQNGIYLALPNPRPDGKPILFGLLSTYEGTAKQATKEPKLAEVIQKEGKYYYCVKEKDTNNKN